MSEWIEYKGTDEQIEEIKTAKNGLCLKFEYGEERFVFKLKDISSVDGRPVLPKTVTHYLICNPHPLADMIERQCRTGQEVHIRSEITDYILGSMRTRYLVVVTDKPDWNIPGAEYSFTPFEDGK